MAAGLFVYTRLPLMCSTPIEIQGVAGRGVVYLCGFGFGGGFFGSPFLGGQLLKKKSDRVCSLTAAGNSGASTPPF